jgi:hypothetical protein
MRSSKAIADALAAHKGGIERFVRQLDRDKVPYLSYSKIASVEFCSYRYYLEYVKGVRPRPEPAYFAKGRTLHNAADHFYRKAARGLLIGHEDLFFLAQKHDDEDRRHLHNAIQVLVEQAWTGWEVLGVEEPFVLPLGKGLPPCVGVVDLVLRKDGVTAVVDHKTGKRFNELDPMQVAVYRQHVLRKHRTKECSAWFDQYRWVDDLGRIRKPAFQRTQVHLRSTSWATALRRFHSGYKRILRIEETQDARATGFCHSCTLKDVCEKAVLGYGAWWYPPA